MLNFIIKRVSALIWDTFKIKKSPKHIIIMSHMRSGSSLLMHILSSNSEILGWGEGNFKYSTARNITEIELRSRWYSKTIFKTYGFIADQVNHNKWTPNIPLFDTSNTYVIFLIREPLESISSIYKLSKKYYGGMTQQEAVDYYIERLNYLKSFSSKVNNAKQFITTYDDLTDNSLKTLNSLTAFLNLEEPLKGNYTVQKYTGTSGDPSSNIETGKIIKTTKKLISIEENLKLKAKKAYLVARKDLKNSTKMK